MAHVEDRWFRPGPDGAKTGTSRHGTGLRWRVRYLDPGGAERSKSFARKPDAERFMNAAAAKVQDGTWSDPALGKMTLRRYVEQTYLPAQVTEATSYDSCGEREQAEQAGGYDYRGVPGSTIQDVGNRPQQRFDFTHALQRGWQQSPSVIWPCGVPEVCLACELHRYAVSQP